MATQCCIAGYEEAIRAESRDRAMAILDLPEILAGVQVSNMTPLHMEYLKAADNPFICGGIPTVAAYINFVWILSSEFKKDKQAADDFAAKLLEADGDQLKEDIDAYLERTFLDAPSGGQSIPYYSGAIGLVYAMGEPPMGWDYDRTMNTPLRIIFQLLKASAKNKGFTVINKRSDKVSGDWLDDIQKKLDAGEIVAEDLEKLNG